MPAYALENLSTTLISRFRNPQSYALLLGLFVPLIVSDTASVLSAETASARKSWATLNVDKAQQSKHERNVRNILRDPKEPVNEQNVQLLENYLRKYFFARMTARENLSALPQYRQETSERCGWTAGKDTDAGEEMNRIVSSLMHALCNGVLEATGRDGEKQNVIVVQRSVRDSNNKLRLVRSLVDLKTDDRIFSLAGDAVEQSAITELVPSGKDFHPAVKLNAVLILGDLNDKQPKRNRPETAEPRLNTQMDLIAYLQSPDQLSDVLLVGALTGMQRHARESLDPQTKKRVGKVLLEILKSQRMTARDPSVVIWVRRQAIDTLAQLKPKNEKIFLRVIENANEPVQLRIAAVEAVQKLNLTNLSPGSIDRFAKGLAQLAVDICEEERAAAITPRSSFSPDRLRMRIAALQNILLYGGDDTTKGLLAIAPAADADILTQLADTLKKISVQIQVLSAATDRKQIDGALRENINDLQIFLKTDEDEKASSPQTAENG